MTDPVVGDGAPAAAPTVGPESAAGPTAGRKPDHDPMRKTVRDMALSMGLIAGIIFLVLLVTWRPQPDPVREVDPVPVAEGAALIADYPILLPAVGEGWRATSARFTQTEESDNLPVWFNGWVTPGEQYAAIVQSSNTTENFIEEQTIGGIEADDAPPTPGWDAFESPSNGQRSLVRIQNGVATVVTGSVEWPELIAFRDSLQPVRPPGR